MNILHVTFFALMSGVGTQLVEVINHYPDKTAHHTICCEAGIYEGFREMLAPALQEGRVTLRPGDGTKIVDHVKATNADVVHISDACFMKDAYYSYLETGIPFLTVFQTSPIFECSQLNKPLLGLMNEDNMPLCSVSYYSTLKYQLFLQKNNINYKNVYISKSKSLHSSKKNLDNENEIEQYLLHNNYMIVNPENMTIDDFINNVRYADNIVITWGSALTNMVYLKTNANVCILKSEHYNPEHFSYFEKIAKKYSLNIKIINNVNNKIEIPFL